MAVTRLCERGWRPVQGQEEREVSDVRRELFMTANTAFQLFHEKYEHYIAESTVKRLPIAFVASRECPSFPYLHEGRLLERTGLFHCSV